MLSQFCGSIHIALHLRQAYYQIRFVPLSANGGTKTFFFFNKLHLKHVFEPCMQHRVIPRPVSVTLRSKIRRSLYTVERDSLVLFDNPLVLFVMAVGREYLQLSVKPEPIFVAKASICSKTLPYLLVLEFKLPRGGALIKRYHSRFVRSPVGAALHDFLMRITVKDKLHINHYPQCLAELIVDNK